MRSGNCCLSCTGNSETDSGRAKWRAYGRGSDVGWTGMEVVGLGDGVPNVGRVVGKGKRTA